VQGARVRLGTKTVGVTGRRGRVRRPSLRLGRNKLHASKRGYRASRTTFTIVAEPDGR
jgi:hypothetical protein